MELRLLTKEEFKKNIPQLNDLFKFAFKRSLQKDFLKWRYLDNPINDLLVAVAIDEGKIVANYSASPVLVENENGVFKTALSMTTMTHPDYNGRGLFTSLANLLYEEMKKKNYNLVWGFPNINSHGIFMKKLGWENIYEIPNFAIKLTSIQNESIKFNEQIEEDNEFNNSLSFFSYDNKYQVSKSQEYYKWRYFHNPINNYVHLVFKEKDEIVGNVIYKEFDDMIDVLELNGVNDKVKQQLILDVIKRASEQNKIQINTWVNLYDDFHVELEKIGFCNEFPITYIGARKISFENISMNYSNWNIQMGDSDVY